MEPLEIEKNEIDSRAKELDTGAIPLSMENVILGIPQKFVEFRDLASVIANDWSFKELISQKKLYKTITINGSSTSGIIELFRNSWNEVIKYHFNTMKDVFLLKSWTLNYLFEVRSNFQQVGMMNLFYTNIPQILIPYIVNGNRFASFQTQTQLPHRKVFFGEDSDILVSLKWLSPWKSSLPDYHYFYSSADVPGNDKMYDDYDMGTLYLSVPYPMEVAAGVSANKTTIRVWTFLSDLEYSGYNISDNVV